MVIRKVKVCDVCGKEQDSGTVGGFDNWGKLVVPPRFQCSDGNYFRDTGKDWDICSWRCLEEYVFAASKQEYSQEAPLKHGGVLSDTLKRLFDEPYKDFFEDLKKEVTRGQPIPFYKVRDIFGGYDKFKFVSMNLDKVLEDMAKKGYLCLNTHDGHAVSVILKEQENQDG